MKFRHRADTGTHHFGRLHRDGLPRFTRPGDIVECELADLAGAAWKFEPLGRVATETAVAEPPPLEIVARGGGWFDIRHKGTRRILNEKPMRLTEAEAFVGVGAGGKDRDAAPAEVGEAEGAAGADAAG